jgi:hypothetical protein
VRQKCVINQEHQISMKRPYFQTNEKAAGRASAENEIRLHGRPKGS